MSWYVYIAQAQTGNYYVGISTEPERRIRDHNAGKGAVMARSQGPFVLVYVSPALAGQGEARRAEMRLKKWRRAQKRQLIFGEISFAVVLERR